MTAPARARDRVVTREDARRLAADWRGRGERVVLTDGVFDLLHVGHLRFLGAARSQGDRLIVAILDDAAARALEGEGHPVVLAHDRARMVAALRGVDAVVVVGDPSVDGLRHELEHDVYLRGSVFRDEPGEALIERIRRIGTRRDG